MSTRMSCMRGFLAELSYLHSDGDWRQLSVALRAFAVVEL